MGDVVLLRPFVPSKTLKAMARERRAAAALALMSDDEGRYEQWIAFRKQAFELDVEASKAEHWENECELTRRAAARLLDKALEAAQNEGA